MKTTKKLLVTISAAALLTSACDPSIGGQEGNLDLTYDEGPVAGASASSPLAVGAMLDYSGYVSGDKNQKVSFVSATSDDDAIIRVDETNGGLMTLEAVADGQAVIDVEATGPDGASISDAFDIEAATVDGLEFDHPCAPGADAVYLVDHDIRLHYTMRAGGSIAVGYGYYPVEFEPAEALSLGSTTANGLLPLHTGTDAGEATISSTVDDTEFTLTLAEEADIDGITIFEQEFADNSNLPVGVDQELPLHVIPTISGLLPALQEPAPVCQTDLEVQAETSTPDICEVTYAARTSQGSELFHLYEPNVLTVSGKSQGTCEFSISIPGANGGAGTQESFSVTVSEGASDDGEANDGEQE